MPTSVKGTSMHAQAHAHAHAQESHIEQPQMSVLMFNRHWPQGPSNNMDIALLTQN